MLPRWYLKKIREAFKIKINNKTWDIVPPCDDPPHPPDTLIDSDHSVYNSKSLFDFGPFKDQQLKKYEPFKDQIH